jgi:hypothetical protein
MRIAGRRIDPVEQAAEETFALLHFWLICFDVVTH